jgi:light-regulated signal transduction histidine kinase (bacteriophytochrome)
VTKILEELVPKETDRKFEITVDALPAITGDPGLLRQVFVSLIGNAVKFTRHCSTAKIRIGGSETAEQSTITIHDNGCGFDMKYSDKLFGIFQRLHSEQEYEGSGVGLAIVRRIIQRHDGTVSAFAEPGKGTRVTVTVLKPQPQR